ncbi:cation transporter [Azorhizobium caulinodans]|uniref:cation transporter n=1 Tax=Azorhizobium caulinodans TaxID=7 RepID=UPI002FBE6D8F
MRMPQVTTTVAVIAALMSWPAYAADKTVVLDVKNADCVLCPPIVKQSLLRVKGVNNVEIRQADQMADFLATVTFDDTVTNAPALIAATTNAGYPSQLASAN